MSLSLTDKGYWFWRNASAMVLSTCVIPIYFTMQVLEGLFDGIRITLRCDGSEILNYPWQHEWPFFRGEDDES